MQAKGKLFWLKTKRPAEDLLVFWAGDPLGNIYVYEFKETKNFSELYGIIDKRNREFEISELNYRNTYFSAGEWHLIKKEWGIK